MTILGIETSCDETAIAVLEIAITKNHPPAGRAGIPKEIKVLSNIVSSQIKLHAEYGGVVPNLAAREHTKNILHVFETALKKAGISDFNKEVDLIAVTHGPGLGPALLVGLTFAKTIAMIHKKTIVGVNHMRGHIYSNWLQPIGEFSNSNFPRPRLGSAEGGQFSKGTFPILNLIVSGGHTELVLMSTEGRSASGGEDKFNISYWTGLDHVGDFFKNKAGVDTLVSFDVVDLIMSLVKQGEVKYLYHQQEAMWNHIFSEYLGRDRMNALTEENIISGFISL